MLKQSVIFLTLVLITLISSRGFSALEKKMVEVRYFKYPFGHIHQNPSRFSTSLSTVSCGHPVKIYQSIDEKGKALDLLVLSEWYNVKVGPYEGYMEAKHLETKKPECFQAKYAKFFDELNLEISEFYYWGKLYDQYQMGKSKVNMK